MTDTLATAEKPSHDELKAGPEDLSKTPDQLRAHAHRGVTAAFTPPHPGDGKSRVAQRYMLAIQRSAGNRAATTLVQRLATKRPTPVQRLASNHVTPVQRLATGTSPSASTTQAVGADQAPAPAATPAGYLGPTLDPQAVPPPPPPSVPPGPPPPPPPPNLNTPLQIAQKQNAEVLAETKAKAKPTGPLLAPGEPLAAMAASAPDPETVGVHAGSAPSAAGGPAASPGPRAVALQLPKMDPRTAEEFLSLVVADQEGQTAIHGAIQQAVNQLRTGLLAQEAEIDAGLTQAEAKISAEVGSARKTVLGAAAGAKAQITRAKSDQITRVTSQLATKQTYAATQINQYGKDIEGLATTRGTEISGINNAAADEVETARDRLVTDAKAKAAAAAGKASSGADDQEVVQASLDAQRKAATEVANQTQTAINDAIAKSVADLRGGGATMQSELAKGIAPVAQQTRDQITPLSAWLTTSGTQTATQLTAGAGNAFTALEATTKGLIAGLAQLEKQTKGTLRKAADTTKTGLRQAATSGEGQLQSMPGDIAVSAHEQLQARLLLVSSRPVRRRMARMLSTELKSVLQSGYGMGAGQAAQLGGKIASQFSIALAQFHTQTQQAADHAAQSAAGMGHSGVGQLSQQEHGVVKFLSETAAKALEGIDVSLTDQLTKMSKIVGETDKSLKPVVDKTRDQVTGDKTKLINDAQAKTGDLDDRLMKAMRKAREKAEYGSFASWFLDQVRALGHALLTPSFWVGLLVGLLITIFIIATFGGGLAVLVIAGAVAGALAAGASYLAQVYLDPLADPHAEKKKFSWSELGTNMLVGGIFGAVGGAVGGGVSGIVGKTLAKEALTTVVTEKVAQTVVGAAMGTVQNLVGGPDAKLMQPSTWKWEKWDEGLVTNLVVGGVMSGAGKAIDKINVKARAGMVDSGYALRVTPEEGLASATRTGRDPVVEAPVTPGGGPGASASPTASALTEIKLPEVPKLDLPGSTTPGGTPGGGTPGGGTPGGATPGGATPGPGPTGATPGGAPGLAALETKPVIGTPTPETPVTGGGTGTTAGVTPETPTTGTAGGGTGGGKTPETTPGATGGGGTGVTADTPAPGTAGGGTGGGKTPETTPGATGGGGGSGKTPATAGGTPEKVGVGGAGVVEDLAVAGKGSAVENPLEAKAGGAATKTKEIPVREEVPLEGGQVEELTKPDAKKGQVEEASKGGAPGDGPAIDGKKPAAGPEVDQREFTKLGKGDPPATEQELALQKDSGTPVKHQREFIRIAKKNGAVLDVRPTNPEAPRLLAEGSAVPKPEAIKAKSINGIDTEYLGFRNEDAGLVGYKEMVPKEAFEKILEGVPENMKQKVRDRYNQRADEYKNLRENMADLARRPTERNMDHHGYDQVVTVDEHGVLRTTTAEGKAVGITGDHDLFMIRDSVTGEQITGERYNKIVAELKDAGIGVLHGAHMNWDVPANQQHIFDPIVEKHGPAKVVNGKNVGGEALVTFGEEGSGQRFFEADKEAARNQARTAGQADKAAPNAPVVEHAAAPAPTALQDLIEQGQGRSPEQQGSMADLRSMYQAQEAEGMVAPVDVRSTRIDQMIDQRTGAPLVKPDGSPYGYGIDSRFEARRFTLGGGENLTQITMKVQLEARPGVGAANIDKVMADVRAGVDQYYNTGKARLPNGDQVKVVIDFVTDPKDAHLTVDLAPGNGRADQSHWFVDSPSTVHAHELGHQMGLLDEYVDPSTVNRGTPTASGVKDDSSLMGNFWAAGGGVDPNTQVHDRHWAQIGGDVDAARGTGGGGGGATPAPAPRLPTGEEVLAATRGPEEQVAETTGPAAAGEALTADPAAVTTDAPPVQAQAPPVPSVSPPTVGGVKIDPTDNSISVGIEGEVGDPIKNRAKNAPNYNADYMTAKEAGLPDDYVAAHLWGPGFDNEQMTGMMLAPSEVNSFQNTTVEAKIREMRAWAKSQGGQVFCKASAESYPRTGGFEVLKRATYEFEIRAGGRVLEKYTATISVGPPPDGKVTFGL